LFNEVQRDSVTFDILCSNFYSNSLFLLLLHSELLQIAKELLTDVTVRNAKPTDKDKRLNDGGGLYLLIKPNGAKWWRFDYTIAAKRKTLSIGVYPATGLADARRKAQEVRNQNANGIDPSDTCKEAKAVQRATIENEKRIDAGLAAIDSFEFVALEWYDKRMLTKSESHQKRTLALLKRDLFPWLGNRPMAEIKAPELLKVLERIENRNAIETAHRALQLSGQVFRYAESKGYVDHDISQALKGALSSVDKGHFAAITDPIQAAHLLRAIDSFSGTFSVKSALQLAPLVFIRPGELRLAEWEHIDINAKEWRYFVTKTKTPHIVPLSTQAIKI
jgi:hypothetical protein